MSDIFGIRSFLGNFGGRLTERESPIPHPGLKRPLREECQSLSVYAVQRALGKKPLLAAIREARSFRLPLPGGAYADVWVTYESHCLPGRIERWSSLEEGNARLKFQCQRCRKAVIKLYYSLLPGSAKPSPLWCRECHDLTYQSTNCGGNRWYKQGARPLKRLRKERERLLARRNSSRIRVRLEQIDAESRTLREQGKPKTKRKARKPGNWERQRRPYRDLSLLE